ncbi:hypothetical protein ACP3V3_02915 [Vibrio sp. PNB22_3_1]
MLGSIVRFKPDAGTGQILGEDGSRYAFKLADVKNADKADALTLIGKRSSDLIGVGCEFDNGLKRSVAVATDIVLDVNPHRYGLVGPDKFNIVNGFSVQGFCEIRSSGYYICASGRDLDALRSVVEQEAQEVGANACVGYLEQGSGAAGYNVSASPVIVGRHQYVGQEVVQDDFAKVDVTELCERSCVRAARALKVRRRFLAMLSVAITMLAVMSSIGQYAGLVSSALIFGIEERIALIVLPLFYMLIYFRSTAVRYSPIRTSMKTISRLRWAPLVPMTLIVAYQSVMLWFDG